MQIQDIFLQWDKDCKIDATQLDVESLDISKLHNKYYKMYIEEKIKSKKQKSQLAILKNDKREFYTLGPTEETKQKGWVLPPQGKILKNEVELYLASDKELVDISLKIGIQEEKLELLKSILETIGKRSFQIRAAIDFMKIQNAIV